MRPLNVLIACEASGAVRSAFRALGHNAFSCDIRPAEDGAHALHLQCNAIHAIRDGMDWSPWDLVIAHPPCTHLSASGALHWKAKRADGRQAEAIAFLLAIRDACEAIGCAYAIENPVGIMSKTWRRPDQIIQPYHFGHDASKKTCLWLHKLPPLKPTGPIVPPRLVNGLPRWSNQTDTGQNRVSQTSDRWRIRSKTYSGIANAMASQWSAALSQ